MKIVSVGLYNPIPINSGVDSYICYLLNSIGKYRDIKHYYLYHFKEENGHYPKEKNFETEFLKSKLIKKFNLDRMPKSIKLIRPEFLFENFGIKKIYSDLVICDVFTYHIAKKIAKNNKSSIILIMHNIEWKYLQSYGSYFSYILRPYEQYVQNIVDAIITISYDDYIFVSKYINKNKIHYVPPDINTNIFNPDGPIFNYGNDKMNLLFYGSLDRPMNIEALRIIKQQLIPKLKDEGLLGKIRINIFGSGIPPKFLNIDNDKDINYLGIVDDPGKYIRGADLNILPLKHSGGMKIRLLEILYCGKPVIASQEAAIGLPEDLKDSVYIKDSLEGFTEIISSFLDGKKETRINNNIIRKYLTNSKTLNDVIVNIV